ncbi:gamma carbonic anhydrase family protein [Desulforamulus aeronauticus]|uniref:Carbonic anhydrase or acetyltransferase, isoleucine patch superfamily n=1 Tax=Desulforamulus aeronauticus DSM 10349 TaxID=1121421 RepID=A0A1M6QRL6_9FIRM|nr:gamma carbonic anhydrase family protein [Desulforamulus aeronauticus]SHK22874.1 Carbonic anhydrase or acetyltransferase, isoleucine patch superfamily [Desulforamulus aeronauticus DSM 10349]
MILPYLEQQPKIASSVYIAPGAMVVGQVELMDEVSIWYNAVIRGDVAGVCIGRTTNIQDGCLLHQNEGIPLIIGEEVTVGHGALLHGCTIGDGCLIGMGAIILTGAKIGKETLIGAGALVKENQEIPEGVLVVGSPARIVRSLSVEERQKLRESARNYVKTAQDHQKSQKKDQVVENLVVVKGEVE